jgi:hypothetical protein
MMTTFCKKDCTRLAGFNFVQECTTALRCLAYDTPLNTQDDYFACLSRHTMTPCTSFVGQSPQCLDQYYLRAPNEKIPSSYLGIDHNERIFWILGSIDCIVGDVRIIHSLGWGCTNAILESVVCGS